MKNSCGLQCLLAVLVTLGSGARLTAQHFADTDKEEERIRRSHLLDLVPLPAAGDAEDLLEQRLQGKRNQNIAEQLKRFGIGPELLEILKEKLKDPQFREKLKDLQSDPGIPEELRNKLKSLPQSERSELESKLSPQLLDDLKQRLKPESLEGGEAITSQQGNRGAGSEMPAESPRPANEPNTMPGTDLSGSAGISGKPTTSPELGSPLARSLLSFARRMERLNPALGQSAALHAAVRELGRHVGEPDERWQQLARGADALGERWKSLREALHLDRMIPKDGFRWPASLTPRSLPDFRLGEQGLRAERPALTWSGPSTEAGTPSLRALLVILGLAAGAVAIWKLGGKWQFSARRVPPREWDAGPWPVDPAQVSTRGELVQAFEHLSLLLLGPEASAWNHRTIALQLGLEELGPRSLKSLKHSPVIFPNAGERRLVADELATLYEQARYSPPTDALPDRAFAMARRELARFAGVSSA